jgi:alkylation response protein AidB-like acyl-CoA dehydrogenase
LKPYCHEWDEQKLVPKNVFEEAAKAGIFNSIVSHTDPKYFEYPMPANIDHFDAFHEFIGILHIKQVCDEVSRCGSGGVLWGLMGGLGIGLPPLINFGSAYLKDKVVRDCLSGRKKICLCITEPSAGSDVANIVTEARKTPDGKFYILNGEKKWITNGITADFFTVACRTGGPGMDGISLLLVEKTMPGISVRQMNCMGMWSSGTTYVTFEDVKVPVENIIGKENKGFKYIMSNFNNERMLICIQANRFARVCYEDAMKYAHKRKTFGKKLVDHPVIRNKLAHMARMIESTHAWMEILIHQQNTMHPLHQFQKLGGPIALLKAQSTQTMVISIFKKGILRS